MLKEAENDSTEAVDDESSNDENIDEDDEEDEDGTEDNNGFMQNRAVQLGGAALGGGVVCAGAAYYFKKGASAKTPQVFTVTVTTALDDAVAATVEGDKNVLKVSDDKRTIYTYDTVDAFKAKYAQATDVTPGPAHAVFALKGFEPEEVTAIQAKGTVPKDSIKDRVILNQDQFDAILNTREFNNKLQVNVGTTAAPLHAKLNTDDMIITKVPPPAPSA